MVFQWYGQSFFRIDTKDAVIAVDPFSKKPDSGFVKVPRFRADVVLISHDHWDHSNVAALEGEPVVLKGPGEYEVKGIFIQGIPSWHDEKNGEERGSNTIFVIETEEMRVCHMGDIGTKKLPEDALERIGDADVLMIPVGGKYTVDAAGAWALIREIEPRIVIPMHYKIPGLTLPIDGPEKFLKEAGAKPDLIERFSIRKKDIPLEGLKTVLMRPLAFSGS